MIAFVLSGGGNQGAMQTGALRALHERNIHPDIVVGTSVGGLNGMAVAYDKSLIGIEKSVKVWQTMNKEYIFPGTLAVAILRLIKGDLGLFSSDTLKQFLIRQIPDEIKTFADLQAARLYIVATQIPEGGMHIFGEDPNESVLEAIMASSAMSPLHSPYKIDDKMYVDGSLVSHLPLRAAVEKGAKTIYALHICHDLTEKPFQTGAIGVSIWAITKLIQDQVTAEINWAKEQPDVTLHEIRLPSIASIDATNYSQSGRLMKRGYAIAKPYLNNVFGEPSDQIISPFRWQEHVTTILEQVKEITDNILAAEDSKTS
ncbi:MAG: hypothetical protein B6242_01850 [Anaerolineaceae bacterium 4572_78]|nr:MAG: hypothetical protein B6242_01850 [Anaerolineaceae bacterium 4572_78]